MADVFTDALRAAFEKLSGIDPDLRDAVYHPTAGDPVSLKIHVRKEQQLQPDGFTAEVQALATTVEAILADLGKEPERGEAFETDTETFTVKQVLSNDGKTVKVVVL